MTDIEGQIILMYTYIMSMPNPQHTQMVAALIELIQGAQELDENFKSLLIGVVRADSRKIKKHEKRLTSPSRLKRKRSFSIKGYRASKRALKVGGSASPFRQSVESQEGIVTNNVIRKAALVSCIGLVAATWGTFGSSAMVSAMVSMMNFVSSYAYAIYPFSNLGCLLEKYPKETAAGKGVRVVLYGGLLYCVAAAALNSRASLMKAQAEIENQSTLVLAKDVTLLAARKVNDKVSALSSWLSWGSKTSVKATGEGLVNNPVIDRVANMAFRTISEPVKYLIGLSAQYLTTTYERVDAYNQLAQTYASISAANLLVCINAMTGLFAKTVNAFGMFTTESKNKAAGKIIDEKSQFQSGIYDENQLRLDTDKFIEQSKTVQNQPQVEPKVRTWKETVASFTRNIGSKVADIAMNLREKTCDLVSKGINVLVPSSYRQDVHKKRKIRAGTYTMRDGSKRQLWHLSGSTAKFYQYRKKDGSLGKRYV